MVICGGGGGVIVLELISMKWDNNRQHLRQRPGTETKESDTRTQNIKKQFEKLTKQNGMILQKKVTLEKR